MHRISILTWRDWARHSKLTTVWRLISYVHLRYTHFKRSFKNALNSICSVGLAWTNITYPILPTTPFNFLGPVASLTQIILQETHNFNALKGSVVRQCYCSGMWNKYATNKPEAVPLLQPLNTFSKKEWWSLTSMLVLNALFTFALMTIICPTLLRRVRPYSMQTCSFMRAWICLSVSS